MSSWDTAPLTEASGDFDWGLFWTIVSAIAGVIGVAVVILFYMLDRRRKKREGVAGQQKTLDEIVTKRRRSDLFHNPHDVTVSELHASSQRWNDELAAAMKTLPSQSSSYADLLAIAKAVNEYRNSVENNLPAKLRTSGELASGENLDKLLKFREALRGATQDHFIAISQDSTNPLTQEEFKREW